jgi:hypothetical protein
LGVPLVRLDSGRSIIPSLSSYKPRNVSPLCRLLPLSLHRALLEMSPHLFFSPETTALQHHAAERHGCGMCEVAVAHGDSGSPAKTCRCMRWDWLRLGKRLSSRAHWAVGNGRMGFAHPGESEARGPSKQAGRAWVWSQSWTRVEIRSLIFGPSFSSLSGFTRDPNWKLLVAHAP